MGTKPTDEKDPRRRAVCYVNTFPQTTVMTIRIPIYLTADQLSVYLAQISRWSEAVLLQRSQFKQTTFVQSEWERGLLLATKPFKIRRKNGRIVSSVSD